MRRDEAGGGGVTEKPEPPTFLRGALVLTEFGIKKTRQCHCGAPITDNSRANCERCWERGDFGRPDNPNLPAHVVIDPK